ncbi:MAG: NADH-quinone oxidoreductase subunit C, partial [Bacillota bacterium]|nr:NADH-quinone oxidoreductase subunit C [Bacillota bacterium]
MKIEFLQKDIEKYGTKGVIKNGNEMYINTSASEIRNIVSRIIREYKLNFVAEFCREGGCFIINVILSSRSRGYFVIISYETEAEIISLQELIYQSHLFEREISDLYGLKISGGRDTRNLVKHEVWEKGVYPLRKGFSYGQKINDKREIEEYGFKALEGEGGYQIPVGPVHAGIIEPGHFRFSVIGEQIENLEIRLMYKHRGIEKIAENIDADALNLLFERVAGESSAAYGEAYAQLVEKMTGFRPTIEVQALRVVLLELERIYNYLDDIAGICVDIGYSYPAKKYGYFSELIHQLCERLTGSRYLRNSIIPCGNNVEYTAEKALDIRTTLNSLQGRLNDIIDMTLNAVSFLDRVEHTGLVYNEKAKRLCMTGIVGRASGISYDVRYSFGYEIYRNIKENVNTEPIGGVFERYKLKVCEIRDAFAFIEKALTFISGDITVSKTRINLKEGLEGVAAVETVKGELVVYGRVGKDNKFDRVYFKTPSFTNWDG